MTVATDQTIQDLHANRIALLTGTYVSFRRILEVNIRRLNGFVQRSLTSIASPIFELSPGNRHIKRNFSRLC